MKALKNGSKDGIGSNREFPRYFIKLMQHAIQFITCDHGEEKEWLNTRASQRLMRLRTPLGVSLQTRYFKKCLCIHQLQSVSYLTLSFINFLNQNPDDGSSSSLWASGLSIIWGA